MRILFLDIDGVLNHYSTYYAFRDDIGCASPHLLHTGKNPGLDPIAVKLLQNVVNKYEFQIVLSSTWRIGYTDEEIINHWKVGMSMYYGWTNPLMPIIGSTPDLCAQQDSGIWVSKTRGQEIQHFIDNYEKEITDYVIIDDDGDMLVEQIPHFYQTNVRHGLNYAFVDWIEDRYS